MPIYLVTGGAGFIGSHLCEALLKRGDQVRVLDDLSTGLRSNLPAHVELVIGDVTDPDAVRAALNGVAGCFHLAAVASVERGVQDWVGTHRVNLAGAVTVFDEIRRTGGRFPVVYASSAAVYGDAPVPITEDTPCRPLSGYGADKYGCELQARVAGHVFGIPSTGLRFFNVYGPRQDPNSPYSGVISIFSKRIAERTPVEVYGDGLQTRDFICVDDVVAALLAGMRRADVGAPVFNTCTGQPTSILDLARAIGKLAGRTPEIRHLPARSGEIRHSRGSPERARAALCLHEPLPLETGLRKVLDWLGGSR